MGVTAERLKLMKGTRGVYNNHWFEVKQIDKNEMFYLVRNLEGFEQDEAIKVGLRLAGNVFKAGGKRRLRARMKSGSQGVTGNLLRSFRVRTKRSKLGVLVGFRQGQKGGGSHAHLVDRGTDRRYWKTKGRKDVGSVKSNMFWSDTEREDYPQAMEKLYIGIEKAVNRISSRR